MTLPDERYRAVALTRKFLEDIISYRSGLSDELKQEAKRLLRHYPTDYDLDRASEGAPDIFARRMEDVTRLFKQYEQSKVERNEN
jgi:hypothetical protein